mmetsp:Transcript_17172/g.37625  ORF Transcript_17172/g.37625 Transcript_17172/m.37625 type:complete len:323 (+) Transcript_17172:66-1034(+)
MWAAVAILSCLLPSAAAAGRLLSSRRAAKVDHVYGPDIYSAFGSAFNEHRPVVATTLGYQKCGTTMIYSVLKLHPDVIGPSPKELHYLAGPEATTQCSKQGPALSFQEYFDDCFAGQRPQAGQVARDFTPTYGTIQFISDFDKNVKALNESETVFRFIAVLREPASRATSAISMRRKNNEGEWGNATDFDLDVALWDRLQERREDGNGSRFITDGEYVTPLARWLETNPRDSLLVLNRNHLSTIPTWIRIFRHLGLRVPSDKSIRKMIRAANLHYTEMQMEKYSETQTAQYSANSLLMHSLHAHYEPYNQKLWELLGTPAWW